jgi:plasmid stabilization system protein ParE
MGRLSILVLSLALGSSFLQVDRTAELRSKFSKENNPVKKAKILSQLAESEFQQIQDQLKADNAAEAAAIVKQMAEEASTCRDALDAKVKNPEDHPDGYRQLQISVRQSLRRIDDVISGLSGDEQTPFREARAELDDVDRGLLRELFPTRPDARAAATDPAPAAPKP